MKFDRYVSSVSNIFINNRLLKFVVIVLALMQAVSYVELSRIDENRRTVIIPVGLTETVEVGNGHADETYLSAMGVYIATLAYSTTPRSVEGQYKMLLTLLTPEAYKSYAENYQSEALSHVKNEVTRNMRITGIAMKDGAAPAIEVSMIINKYIFKDLVEPDKQVRLTIGYKIEYGRFVVTELKESL